MSKKVRDHLARMADVNRAMMQELVSRKCNVMLALSAMLNITNGDEECTKKAAEACGMEPEDVRKHVITVFEGEKKFDKALVVALQTSLAIEPMEDRIVFLEGIPFVKELLAHLPEGASAMDYAMRKEKEEVECQN